MGLPILHICSVKLSTTPPCHHGSKSPAAAAVPQHSSIREGEAAFYSAQLLQSPRDELNSETNTLSVRLVVNPFYGPPNFRY